MQCHSALQVYASNGLALFDTETFVAAFEDLDREVDCVSNGVVRKPRGSALSSPLDHGHSPV